MNSNEFCELLKQEIENHKPVPHEPFPNEFNIVFIMSIFFKSCCISIESLDGEKIFELGWLSSKETNLFLNMDQYFTKNDPGFLTNHQPSSMFKSKYYYFFRKYLNPSDIYMLSKKLYAEINKRHYQFIVDNDRKNLLEITIKSRLSYKEYEKNTPGWIKKNDLLIYKMRYLAIQTNLDFK